jgi:hypothetical protein
VYWFSADFGVTVEEEGISKWADRSGNGADAVQGTLPKRPQLGTFASSNLPGIVFDGAYDYLDLPDQYASFAGGLTFFCVARAVSDPLGSAMVELSNGQEIEDVTFLRYQGGFSYEVANTVEHEDVPTFLVNQPRLVDVVHTTERRASLFMNGNERPTRMESIPTGLVDFELPVVVEKRQQNTIGRTLYQSTTTWPGEIAEILLYSRALSPTEQQNVRRYLSEKWKCCGG